MAFWFKQLWKGNKIYYKFTIIVNNILTNLCLDYIYLPLNNIGDYEKNDKIFTIQHLLK